MTLHKTLKATVAFLLATLFFAFTAAPSFALVPPVNVSATYASSIYYKKLLEVQLTGDMRRDIIAVAKSQIGYCEGDYAGQVAGTYAGDGNYTEYNNYMYGGKSGGWCGMFVSWCAAMAGVPQTILRRATSAKPHYYDGYGFNFISDKTGVSPLAGSEFRGYYDLPVKGGSYVPKAGDLIFFGYYNAKNVLSLPRSAYKHVALVDYCELTYAEDGSVSNMIIHTVEGNVSNKVKEKKYKLSTSSSGWVYDDTYIAAFGIPAYTVNDPVERHPFYDLGEFSGTTLKSGVSNGDVIKLQLALRVLALNFQITPPAVTGNFTDATKTAVTQYQKLKGLTVDGKCGPQSWASIRSELINVTAKYAGDFVMDGDTVLLYKGSETTATLPANCKTVSSYAFYGTKTLQSLSVPKGLSLIEENAFKNVQGLKTISFLGQKEEFSSLNAKTSGNDPYFGAEHLYKEITYNITFDVNGKKTTVQCAKGSLPVFTGSTDVQSDTLLYFFTGWDKPIAPATCDTTYTATYYTLSAGPLLITGKSSGKTFSKSLLTFDVYLKDTPALSAFSFCADYSMYLSDLTFARFLPAFDGIKCDSSLEGMLEFTYEGDPTSSGDLLIGTICFDVSEDFEFYGEPASFIQLFFLATNGYLRHKMPNGEEIDLVAACDLIEVTVYDRFLYDFEEDGVLDISDVTELLSFLSGNDTVTVETLALQTGLSIDDVTELLSLLAYTKSTFEGLTI